MTTLLRFRVSAPIVALLFPIALHAQGVTPVTPVTPQGTTLVATLAPRVPLPSEAASAAITKFSFIAYGDTRGRDDGDEIQAEHKLVIESMLQTIKASAATDPI